MDRDNFDLLKALQAAQTEEKRDQIQFANGTQDIGAVVAGKYLQSKGYEKADEDLLDTMGSKVSIDYDTNAYTLEAILKEALKELGMDEKEIGQKAKPKDKSLDER